jgi:hypothetical protein
MIAVIDRSSAEFKKISLQMMAGALSAPIVITERRTVGPMPGIVVEAIGKNGRRVGRQTVAQPETLNAAIAAATASLEGNI